MAPAPFRRDWQGLTALVIGNAPSMLAEAWEPWLRDKQEDGAKLLTANAGYRLFPFCDSVMCSDRHWLAANTNKPDPFADFFGKEIIVTRPESVDHTDTRMRTAGKAPIERVHPRDIFADPRVLVEGHNSTSTNISMAVLRGVASIILVGVDLAPGPGGRRRSYDDSEDKLAVAYARYEKQVYHLTLQSEHVYRRGVRVLNASLPSGLKCYPYVLPEEI